MHFAGHARGRLLRLAVRRHWWHFRSVASAKWERTEAMDAISVPFIGKLISPTLFPAHRSLSGKVFG